MGANAHSNVCKTERPIDAALILCNFNGRAEPKVVVVGDDEIEEHTLRALLWGALLRPIDAVSSVLSMGARFALCRADGGRCVRADPLPVRQSALMHTNRTQGEARPRRNQIDWTCERKSSAGGAHYFGRAFQYIAFATPTKCSLSSIVCAAGRLVLSARLGSARIYSANERRRLSSAHLLHDSLALYAVVKVAESRPSRLVSVIVIASGLTRC